MSCKRVTPGWAMWKVGDEYAELVDIALNSLLPFLSTYFSTELVSTVSLLC